MSHPAAHSNRVSDEMLIVTQVAPYADGPAGVHGVLDQAATGLRELAAMHGLSPTVVTDVGDVSPDRLEAVRVVALFTIGDTPWSALQKAALHRSWQQRSAAHPRRPLRHPMPTTPGPSTAPCWGARFDGHPWTQDFAVDVVDSDHPATVHLGSRWEWRDEVYLFADLRPDARASRRSPGRRPGGTRSAPNWRVPDCGFPLAWTVEDGAARTFYSALGHFPGAWETPAYLQRAPFRGPRLAGGERLTHNPCQGRRFPR